MPTCFRFVISTCIATSLVLLVMLAAHAEPTTPAQPAAASARSETPLTSTVFAWDKLPVRKTANGERREIASGPTPTLAQFRSHVTTLNPGTAWSNSEKHTDEEIIIIKEGSLEYEINGHLQTANTGSVILLVAGDLHRWRNAGTTPVTYYVFHAVTAEAKAAALAAEKPTPPLKQ